MLNQQVHSSINLKSKKKKTLKKNQYTDRFSNRCITSCFHFLENNVKYYLHIVLQYTKIIINQDAYARRVLTR